MPHHEMHFLQRSGWLRASVLGANDGIISTASLLMGVAAAGAGNHALLITGIAGLVAGALSMATGEIFTPELKEQFPERDWILTRILWLSGTEPGKNRLGNVDTMQRYIYIHGSPEATAFGAPGSHGCVRMRNADLIALFDQVPVGTTVNIHDQPPQDQKRLNQLQNDQQLEARGIEGQSIPHGVND